jgi:hypothetical protein
VKALVDEGDKHRTYYVLPEISVREERDGLMATVR